MAQQDNGLHMLMRVMMVLAAIGALNWGLVGLFNWNLVTALLGTGPVAVSEGNTLTRLVYTMVGVSGGMLLLLMPYLADRRRLPRPHT